MRIILFTGKGGVGKTTIAAASALYAARSGHRCILTSVDPAHSLSDALDLELGAEPIEIEPGLSACEISFYNETERHWSSISGYLERLFRSQGLDPITARELIALPGIEELLNLLAIKRLAAEEGADALFVDCAPSAQTLRLLSLPEALGFYIDRIFPAERRLMKAIRPLAGRFTSLALPEDDVYSAADLMFNEIRALKDLILTPESTSARLVVNPERMVFAESLRTYSSLALYGIPVDAVIINRAADAKKGSAAKKKISRDIYDSFAGSNFFEAQAFGEEIYGIQKLAEFGKKLYADNDPTEMYESCRPFEVEAGDRGYRIKIYMPGVKKTELQIHTNRDELLIEVGASRRRIALPESLVGMGIESAKLENNQLNIKFIKEDEY